ncbi:MAG: hypothetical protein A2W01_08440 [Candidatus Solincola sediminis]|uniref:histidine kinase n=1 Tax=Candidatus Solincola sediminis TaxID=1797199 RepID=A0A1F2WIH9_9ACTN|nr:MAG: hypothetical protein A2Y75_08830 [Candidatus Solincola sediminis]OFW57937.1 MAG: hypothetical protein A2W01_08440 [Candidatus Solincola sediminis]
METDGVREAKRSRAYLIAAAGILLFAGLVVAGRQDYLVFHAGAEIFSSVVGFTIFVIAWHTRRNLENDFLLFLGIAYLFIAALDLVHMLSYSGMTVFKGYGSNLPTQLWIAARYMQAFSLLIAPIFLVRRLRVRLAFAVYAGIFILIILSVFQWRIFPTAFIEGTGLTAFKKISEYVICLILVSATYLLYRKRKELDARVFKLMTAAIAVTIASELSFTLYIDVYGFFNMLGHFLKIVAFYLVYLAIIETGFERPYEILFRKLKQREGALAASENRYMELLNNMKSGVSVYKAKDGGQDFEIVEFNDAAVRMEGLAREAVLGKDLTPVFPCSYQCGLIHMVREVWKDGHSGYFPEVSCSRHPDECWKDFFIYRLPTSEVVAVWEDVTARKLAEQVLARHRDQLEDEVAERTKELEETAARLRALSAQQESVREEEKRRIALEVHDKLGQELTVMKLRLGALLKIVTDDEKVRGKIDEISASVDETIKSIRKISTELRPPVLDDLGLAAALEWQLNALAEQAAVKTSLSATLDESCLDPEARVGLFRISQEALTNIVRHAGAARVDIELSRVDGDVLLSIRDDGRGVSEKDVSGPFSIGILGMKERASALGGQLEIIGEPEGTTVQVRVPAIE